MFRVRRHALLAAALLLCVPASSAWAGRLRLARGARREIPGEREQAGRFIQSYAMLEDRQSPMERYTFRPTHADIERIERLRAGATDTVRVLCLRVEFLPDTTPLTTGNGRMDTLGFYPEGYESLALFHDPPHFKRYFERQMQGLASYFQAQSLGKLCVDYTVMPSAEKAAYQLPREMQFYGDTISYDAIEMGLVRLMRDALKVADEDPEVDFGRYDEFIIFHAGSGLQADFGLRRDSPFDLLAGEIPAGAIEAYLGEPYITVDSGRTHIEQASVLPEMMRQDTMYEDYTNVLGMTGLAGTLYHEFSHLLGAFDLYDVTGVTMGVGCWSLMGYGGWLGDYGAGSPPGVIPGFLDAYHRVALGFVNPLVVHVPRDSVTIFAAQMDTAAYAARSDTTAPTVIKIPISDREYFLLENRRVDVRQPDTIDVDVEDDVVVSVAYGEYDFFQPGSGVLIWHVDERVLGDYGPYNAVNIDPSHKGVDLEEGDGVQDYDVPYWRTRAPDYEIYGYKFDPFSLEGYNSSFTATTHPSTDGYEGKTHLSVSLLGSPDTAARLRDTLMCIRIGWDLYRRGFPVRSGDAPLLAPMAADLDGDDTLEIVTLDTAGQLEVWRSNGVRFRPMTWIGTSTRAVPAIGDVAGDSTPEVVVADNRGRVLVFSMAGGQPVAVSAQDRIVAAPVLVDLDGDGKKEIVVGSTDRRLYAWHGNGEPVAGFPVFVGSEIRAPVAVTNLVSPRLAVLTGDSRLFLLEADGSVVPGFPLTLGQTPYYAVTQPVVADLDRDGQQEIAVVAGGDHDFRLYVVTLAGGIRFRSREVVRAPFAGAAAVADMNGDGYADVLAASVNDIHAFSYNAAPVGNYPLKQESTYVTTELAGNWIITFDVLFQYASSPVVADVDGNDTAEVIIGSPQYGVIGMNGRTGRPARYFPLMTGGSVSAVPLVIDLDGDGDIELCAGSDSGMLYVWDLPGTSNGVRWGCAYHDVSHTGMLSDSELPTPAEEDSTLVQSFYVHPNPAGSEAQVRYRLGQGAAEVRVRMLDMSGEPVGGEMDGPALPGLDNELTLDLRATAPGLYVLRLEVRKQGSSRVRFAKLAVVR